MHVVQALASLNLGGSELVAVELSEFLTATGHRVTVIAGDGPLRERVLHCGAEHLSWPVGRKRLTSLSCVPRLRHWLEAEKPDLLHAHSRLPAWIARLALRRLRGDARPAFVTTVHGHYSVNRYSAVMTSGDRVLAVSRSIREYIENNYPETVAANVVTVPGGIDRQAFPHGYRPSSQWYEATYEQFPELRGRRWLCLPSRLSRYKGHADFLELLARLAVEIPDVHGVIVGHAAPGSRYGQELARRARASGLEDRVTFTGGRTDVRDWMAASEIVFSLCADPPEAFGRTVPEALSLGVPVIGWDHGGVGETLSKLFPEGAVPPRDHLALYERCLQFLQGRPRVPVTEAYGLSASMQAQFAVYRELLGMGRA
jgi:glycosyltransferase involved in cell wall biosynthesis